MEPTSVDDRSDELSPVYDRHTAAAAKGVPRAGDSHNQTISDTQVLRWKTRR